MSKTSDLFNLPTGPAELCFDKNDFMKVIVFILFSFYVLKIFLLANRIYVTISSALVYIYTIRIHNLTKEKKKIDINISIL